VKVLRTTAIVFASAIGAGCVAESEPPSASAAMPPSRPAAVDGAIPFDRGATAGALGSVDYSSCAAPGGPFGQGHVSIAFRPDGSVESVVVDQPPYAGTAVGNCVAGKDAAVRIPAFSGHVIKVGKSFHFD
jgi:hypothetical protein